ncbi:glycosyltransferase family 4 protein [Silvanigrella paludirubra]|nr:glycosyltransferase family 4 protein [Silvanigrella paludirubra]
MQKNISILHVNTSEAFGGLELYTIQLIKKIMESGIHTAIYCIKGSKIDEEAQKLGIKIYYGFKQARISFSDIKYLRKIIKYDHFQIIHSHTRQDVWLCSLSLLFLKDKKQIFSLYMSAPSKKDIIHKFIYSKVTAITSSSEILNERIRKNYPVLPEQVKLLRYGRDLSLYNKNLNDRKNIRESLNTSDNEYVIATMCRIDPGKGVKEIAESILHLKPEIKQKIKIWIMGEPTLHHTASDGTPVYETQAKELYDWLKQFIKSPEAENKIQLIPFQKNIVPYLNAMDIFVLGTYKETYSLSVIDAMAMGLPVIGTNSGGTPEQVLNNIRGFLIEPRSSKEIANAITKYVENPKLICEHGENAKKWVFSEHNWQNKVTKLQSLYSETLEK